MVRNYTNHNVVCAVILVIEGEFHHFTFLFDNFHGYKFCVELREHDPFMDKTYPFKLYTEKSWPWSIVVFSGGQFPCREYLYNIILCNINRYMYKAIKDYNIHVCMQMPLTQPTPQFLRYPKCLFFFY